MLRKIISIKNVGRFRNSGAPGNPQLAKYALIVGANGFGKTTICAVLRSLQTGDPSPILGRRTLGSTDAPAIELLLDTGTARFDGTTWSATKPGLAIFDGVFVAENVHSGEVVDIEHKRNLYRVIIGEDGVKLAAQDADLAVKSRAKTGEITAAAKGLQSHAPAGMKLESFLALYTTPDIETQIEEQERTVDAVRQAGVIRDHASLSLYTLPALPDGFEALLARTLDHVADDAERVLNDHLAAHGMSADSANWIARGLPHAGASCPFCGQDIRRSALIAAFRAVFSDGYRDLVAAVTAMQTALSHSFGDPALAKLSAVIEQNTAALDFWAKYCAIDALPLWLPADFIHRAQALGAAALSLIERKGAGPLQAVTIECSRSAAPTAPDELQAALPAYEEVMAAARRTNGAITAVNQLINDKKASIGAADLAAAEAELARRRTIKTRHSEAVAALCQSYTDLVAKKVRIDTQKETVRAKLDAHTKNVVKPYERRINEYLTAFNAGFSITETKHAFPGGIAASSYQLVINNTAVDVGDSKTPANRPSFKNTLSAGDRTTLALAFFFAHLERDPGLAAKVVVFDDPFSSQDAFRRRQTVHEIVKIAGRCAQIIVLSHDPTFLRQVWDKAPAADRVSLTLADHRAQGSKLLPIDLDMACRGRTVTDIDDLQTYLTTGAGALLDIIRKMRVVLEAYCRTTYPNYFLVTDWLGDVVRKIREGGDEHPAHDLYDELDQINDYTSQYHHGEDKDDATPDQIDPTELTGFARRTLRVVNALQA